MRLPNGFAVRLATEVRISGDGRTLAGGSPLRMLHLKAPLPAIASDGFMTVRDGRSAVVAARLLASRLAHPVVDALPADLADVTVVIPTRDRPGDVQRALQSLPQVTTLVVDDCSRKPDELEAVVRRHGAQLVRASHNLGPGGARNLGARHVTTPYVAFVDSDVTLTTGALARLIRHFADPNVAAVAPRIGCRAPRGSWQSRWEREASSLDLGPRPGIVAPLSPIGWVPSACLVIRCVDFDGFAEDSRVAEDVDLVWRLEKRGRQVRYDPDALALHGPRATRREWVARKFVYGTGAAWLAGRHGKRVAPAIFTPASAVCCVALVTAPRLTPATLLAYAAVVRHRVHALVPSSEGRELIERDLVLASVGGVLRQIARLTLRDWLPLTLILAVRSCRVRYIAGAACLFDVLDHSRQYRGNAFERFAVRRVDDLAYAAGVWTGATRTLQFKPLMPLLYRHKTRPRSVMKHPGSDPSCNRKLSRPPGDRRRTHRPVRERKGDR